MNNVNLENYKTKKKNILDKSMDMLNSIDSEKIRQQANNTISYGRGVGGTNDDLAFLSNSQSYRAVEEIKNKQQEDLKNASDSFFKGLKAEKKSKQSLNKATKNINLSNPKTSIDMLKSNQIFKKMFKLPF